MVREPGAKLLMKFKGTVCAGLLYVEGPASSKRTRRLASASVRRLATTHAAVPPVKVDAVSGRKHGKSRIVMLTTCDNDIVFFVDHGGSRHH